MKKILLVTLFSLVAVASSAFAQDKSTEFKSGLKLVSAGEVASLIIKDELNKNPSINNAVLFTNNGIFAKIENITDHKECLEKGRVRCGISDEARARIKLAYDELKSRAGSEYIYFTSTDIYLRPTNKVE